MYPLRLPKLPDLVKALGQAGCQAASLKTTRVHVEFLSEIVFQVMGVPAVQVR
jgi:hypothetical protein